MALNILDDHVHCLIKVGKNELNRVVRNIKGYSSFALSKHLNILQKGDGRQNRIWAKGFFGEILNTKEQVDSVIKYIRENHIKRGLTPIKYDKIKIQVDAGMKEMDEGIGIAHEEVEKRFHNLPAH